MKNLLRNEAAPPLKRVVNILEELHRQGVKEILLLGGDPCTYPDLAQALRAARDLGFHNIILSNTLGFATSRLATTLACLDSAETTILGRCEEEHDRAARKRGAYRILLRNVRRINAVGRSVGVCLNATPANAHHLFELALNLLEKERVLISHFMVQRIVPLGGAAGSTKFDLSLNDAVALMQQVAKISTVYNVDVVFEDPLPLCVVPREYHRFLSPCAWGWTKGAINNRGDVSRCGADPRYGLGNIFERELRHIWHQSSELQRFRQRSYLPQSCRQCPQLEVCGGGCALSLLGQSPPRLGVDSLYAQLRGHPGALNVHRRRQTELPDGPGGASTALQELGSDE